MMLTVKKADFTMNPLYGNANRRTYVRHQMNKRLARKRHLPGKMAPKGEVRAIGRSANRATSSSKEALMGERSIDDPKIENWRLPIGVCQTRIGLLCSKTQRTRQSGPQDDETTSPPA